MSSKILLQNMMFYGFHGVHEYEKELGQKFYIDVEIKADLSKAGKSDCLQDTVDYTHVYSKVKEVVETCRYNLLEALGTHIADVILEDVVVSEVIIRIRKQVLPISGPIDYIEVEISKQR